MGEQGKIACSDGNLNDRCSGVLTGIMLPEPAEPEGRIEDVAGVCLCV